jgi:hypothetical protein
MPDRDILHDNLPRCFQNFYGDLCEERNWDAGYKRQIDKYVWKIHPRMASNTRPTRKGFEAGRLSQKIF